MSNEKKMFEVNWVNGLDLLKLNSKNYDVMIENVFSVMNKVSTSRSLNSSQKTERFNALGKNLICLYEQKRLEDQLIIDLTEEFKAIEEEEQKIFSVNCPFFNGELCTGSLGEQKYCISRCFYCQYSEEDLL